MKTAISLPDEVFDEAEHLAKRLDLSRNDLYARALEEFLARHAPDRVTDALDAVCEVVETRPDRFVSTAARRALERDEW
jgi:predicted transcriptional regulator